VTFAAGGPDDVKVEGRSANLGTLVLRNLVQNACEAVGAGGAVRVTGARRSAGGVDFEVTDNGRGLPAAVRERLFQPCTSAKPGGSGVGLALSYQLAQQAGGRLELVRSDERGTTFRLVLPGEA
jgi:signal transduction histidine kinase